MKILLIAATILLILASWMQAQSARANPAGEEISPVIDKESMMNRKDNLRKATFAAGCFWGVETAFRRLDGVVATRVGYTGGKTEHPGYKEVCAGKTGHAEAVEVTYDPEATSYEDLLAVFWEIHNPTTRNGQGPDIGSQYRSAIFYHSEEQERLARASKRRLEEEKRFTRPIVTEITEAHTFWEAEEYHQQYLEKQGRASCHI